MIQLFLCSLFQQGLSEPEFYADLVCKFKNKLHVYTAAFSDQKKYHTSKRIDYYINVIGQSARGVLKTV